MKLYYPPIWSLLLSSVAGLNVLSSVFIKNSFTKCIYSKNNLSRKCFSLEHVIPRSFLPIKIQNDPMNLYPCNIKINKYRSNYAFKDTTDPLIMKETALHGYFIDKKGRIIYITDEVKGIVGRTVIHFFKTYKLKLDNFIPLDQAMVWDKLYPPSSYELRHNVIVDAFCKDKKNRNRNSKNDLGANQMCRISKIN